jgi:CRAL/TRIO domain
VTVTYGILTVCCCRYLEILAQARATLQRDILNSPISCRHLATTVMNITMVSIEMVWNWSRSIAYSHIIALLLLLWLWRLQPSSASMNNDDFYPRRRAISNDVDDESTDTAGTVDDEKPFSLNHDQLLEDRVPHSTSEERTRFLVAKKGNVNQAAKCLSAYLEWRFAHQALEEDLLAGSSGDEDLDDWHIAAAAAIARFEKVRVVLPRLIRTHHIEGQGLCDRDGCRLFHIIPGMMDERLVSLTTYSLAISLYIDRKLKRDSMERVTVLIDVRGGEGWRNLNVAQLLPFIQHTSMLLLSMFPERLYRSLVYPLPPAFGWIWQVVRRYIDPLTREKICLLTGPALIASPVPSDQMTKYLSESVVEHLEKERIASFKEALC